MLSPSNYKHLMLRYGLIKVLVRRLKLTKEDIINEMEQSTTVGEKIKLFMDEINEGADVETTIDDLMDMVYGEGRPVNKEKRLI